MRRREFTATLLGVAAFSVAAYAQQTGKLYRIGFLTAGASGATNTPGLPAFATGLQDLGHSCSRKW
jgi:hypothetical protein